MPERFRKKPVIVEAIQYTDVQSLREIEAWSRGMVRYTDDGILCSTFDGPEYVSDDDWITKDRRGCFSPISADLFEEFYEEESMTVSSSPLVDDASREPEVSSRTLRKRHWWAGDRESPPYRNQLHDPITDSYLDIWKVLES